MNKKKVFSPELSSLANMLAFIEEQARLVNIEGKELSRIKLAGEEILVNIINYGFKDVTKESFIHLSCSFKEHLFTIKVEDNGIPFNPLENKPDIDVNAPLEKRTYGGYGIFLTAQIMDHMEYTYKDHKNVLTMQKKV